MKRVVLLAATFLLTQCGSSPQQNAPVQSTPSRRTIAAVAPAPKEFDLDVLYGLTIDELKVKLGKPVKDTEDNMDGSVRNCLFKKNNFLLIANYIVATRRVDILHFVDEAGKIPYKKLLYLGHVDTTSSRYEASASPGPFTREHVGVAITPIEDTNPGK